MQTIRQFISLIISHTCWRMAWWWRRTEWARGVTLVPITRDLRMKHTTFKHS